VISRLLVLTIADTVGLHAAPLLLLFALIGTLAIELPVAALFGVGKRGLLAVLFVNLVTNPLFNAALFGLYGVEIVMRENAALRDRPGRPLALLAVGPVHWSTLATLEIAIVVVEWGLLGWALRHTAGSRGRLLGLSLCTNATSAIVGVVISLVIAGQGL
jgi:hypothetical protein